MYPDIKQEFVGAAALTPSVGNHKKGKKKKKKSSKNFEEGGLSFSFMLHCPATPGGSFSGGDAGVKSPPGFGDRVLNQKLGPLLGLASRQGTGREEPTLALRFHFREVTERNPNEQKPTKVFESPVAQNHQDRAQLHQQLPGAAQGWGRCRDGCPGCRHCLWIGALPHPSSIPGEDGRDGKGETGRNSLWNFTKASVTLGQSTPVWNQCIYPEICSGASASEASS